MANDLQPYWFPGDKITAIARAAVTGKRFQKISGSPNGLSPGVIPCTAGAKCFGVSGADAASGSIFTIWLVGIVPVKAGANLTADQEVQSDGTGQAIVLDTGVALGRVVQDASSGADAMIKLY